MTQASLEASLDWWEFIRHVGELILIAGLICEFLTVAYLHNSGRLEVRAGMFGVFVILLGVGIENIAGSRADETIRSMRAPRHLSPEQQEVIATRVKQFSGTPFDMWIADSQESLDLMREIAAALTKARWTPVAVYGIVSLDAGGGLPSIGLAANRGVRVQIATEKAGDWGASIEALKDALLSEGIWADDGQIVAGKERTNAVHIHVGEKP